MHEAIYLHSLMSSWHAQCQLYFYLYLYLYVKHGFIKFFFPCYGYAVLKDTIRGILHLRCLVIDIWTWPSSHVKRRILYFWIQLNVNIVFFFEHETGTKKRNADIHFFYVINSWFFCLVEMFCS
jgi:hypothetical protein